MMRWRLADSSKFPVKTKFVLAVAPEHIAPLIDPEGSFVGPETFFVLSALMLHEEPSHDLFSSHCFLAASQIPGGGLEAPEKD
jgi:hypothetical protein